MNNLNFLSDVLEDYCTKHDLPFISADDLLYSNDQELTENNKRWLEHYINVWDIIQEVD
tara:strand:- start:52503 stop:52679 length:177 start_codon:yes stop_codon:yes gene_type:complete